ncbi:MAG: helix-turn-helix domain-containing protein [Clostridiales bacterium]|jgi:transcriptional regulator with XRE-family HTH domain|nr:helix-turn-helix domain-containing protein [Clostridiales bacterium]
MTIGKRIKELRIEKGLKQWEIAQRIGYSRSIVTYWENGEKRPTSEAVIALADFFDVSADYLLGRVDEAGKPLAREKT